MDENARLREALADMVALFSADNVLLKGTHLNSTLKLARIALTPAPEAPKGGEGGMPERIWADPPETFDGMDMWRSDPGGKGVEYVRADLVATPSPGADFKAGMMRAAEIADLNAWAHKGSDDYSQGMDAGARHQVKAICDAIRAEAEKITSSDAGGAHGCAVQTSQPGEVPASASPAPLTLRAGKCYRDGHGEVKGPMHAIFWENGEEMLTDSYVVWHPDGTLAGGTREDKRSLVAEVGDAG